MNQANDDFHALAEYLPNPCWIAEADGSIYWYNRAWYEYTGKSPDDMRGWGWKSVHDPETLSSVMQRWLDSLARGRAFEMTFPLRCHDGIFHPFLTRIVPLKDPRGVITRWFGNNVDVSELRAVETALRVSQIELKRINDELERRVADAVAEREHVLEQLAQSRRLEALGQLAGGIAHDINNVLQAVASGLSLIERKADDPASVRRLGKVAAAATVRGASVTARLLAFARKSELRLTAISPATLLEATREILAHTLGTGVSVAVHVTADAPVMLADQAQLETVLLNLALNARDAMPSGGQLIIKAALDEVPDASMHRIGLAPGNYCRIEVCDNGTGMTPAVLARASEPFFTTKPSGKGTGLGLAMARGFAAQSRGGFEIRSAVDEGTVVSVWLPEVPQAYRFDPSASSIGVLIETAAAVLLVDDDDMVREALALQLEELGCRVTQAPGSLQALEWIDQSGMPDLLISDYAMPGMTGLVLLREIRLRHPRMPAVILTGFADLELDFTAPAGEQPSTVFLRKPVSEQDLSGALERLVRIDRSAS